MKPSKSKLVTVYPPYPLVTDVVGKYSLGIEPIRPERYIRIITTKSNETSKE